MGLTAYVSMYAKNTTGADVSGNMPENITALEVAYDEADGRASTAALTPQKFWAMYTIDTETKAITLPIDDMLDYTLTFTTPEETAKIPDGSVAAFCICRRRTSGA